MPSNLEALLDLRASRKGYRAALLASSITLSCTCSSCAPPRPL